MLIYEVSYIPRGKAVPNNPVRRYFATRAHDEAAGRAGHLAVVRSISVDDSVAKKLLRRKRPLTCGQEWSCT